MTKRVEVLFPPEDYEALRQEAERRGESIGELLRDAARRMYLNPSSEERDAAFDRLMSREVDIGTWEELKPLIGRYADKEP